MQFSHEVGSSNLGEQRAAWELATQLEACTVLDLVIAVSIRGVGRLVHTCSLVGTCHLLHSVEAGSLPSNSERQSVADAVVAVHPVVSVDTVDALDHTSRAEGSTARRSWWIVLDKSIHGVSDWCWSWSWGRISKWRAAWVLIRDKTLNGPSLSLEAIRVCNRDLATGSPGDDRPIILERTLNQVELNT